MRVMLRGQQERRWWVYIISKHSRLYVGITTDPHNRLRQHGSPVSCYLEGPMRMEEAFDREKALKRQSTSKKRDLLFESSQQEWACPETSLFRSKEILAGVPTIKGSPIPRRALLFLNILELSRRVPSRGIGCCLDRSLIPFVVEVAVGTSSLFNLNSKISCSPSFIPLPDVLYFISLIESSVDPSTL